MESATSSAVGARLPRPGPTLNAPPFDIRIRRDVLGRRLWRDSLQRIAGFATLVGGDAVATYLAVLIGSMSTRPATEWTVFLPIALALVIAGQATAGSYAPTRVGFKLDRVVPGVLLAGAGLLVVDYTSPVFEIGPIWHIGFLTTAVLLISAQRFCISRAIRYAHSRGVGRTRLMVVGDHDDAWRTLEHLRNCRDDSAYVVGHVARDVSRDPTALGDLTELSDLLESHRIACVVIAAQLERSALRRIVQQCLLHGVAVTLMPDLLGDLACKRFGQINWPELRVTVSTQYVLQMGLKRTLDLVGAAFGLLILSPLLGMIALAVKLDSPGPVFFRQWRPGLAGRPFGMFKFRSMRADAEQLLRADPELYRRFLEADCKLPVELDPRISRLGALLRRTSLDELPQLINVLRGEMSLVGPRPVVGPELQNYGEWMGSFLSVKPGMTGYWQINGRSSVSYPERAHLDVHYITQWSLGLDIKILLRTIPEVVRPRGAF